MCGVEVLGVNLGNKLVEWICGVRLWSKLGEFSCVAILGGEFMVWVWRVTVSSKLVEWI